ncbi:MAG: hypothetical protein JWL81_1222 [Verrucomicrobiales bacterium]|nr:hypothetical protein [Verrucomicrobiales bacterium]
MHAVTKLDIRLRLESNQIIGVVLSGLPSYSRESFVQEADGHWHGDFIISCPVAPNLVDGDFVDDFAPHFPLLLELLNFHEASFQLQIAVGNPGPEEFRLPGNMVALVAALGADLVVTTSTNPLRLEQGL